MAFCSQICRLLGGRGANSESQEPLAAARPVLLNNDGAAPSASASRPSSSQLPEVGVAATGQTQAASAGVNTGDRLAAEETAHAQARTAEAAQEASKMEAAAKAAEVEESVAAESRELVAGEAKAEQNAVAAKAQDEALEASGRQQMVHEQIQEKSDALTIASSDIVGSASAGSPETPLSGSTNGVKKVSNDAEKRIDPEDGRTYTFQELKAYYKGKFSDDAINKYWNDTCKPVGRKKGGGKGNQNKAKSSRK